MLRAAYRERWEQRCYVRDVWSRWKTSEQMIEEFHLMFGKRENSISYHYKPDDHIDFVMKVRDEHVHILVAASYREIRIYGPSRMSVDVCVAALKTVLNPTTLLPTYAYPRLVQVTTPENHYKGRL